MMKRLKILSIIGTRPEVIKMTPVIKELEKYPDEIESLVVFTAQHREMLDQTLKVFGITPHIDLDLMRSNQSLTQLTSSVLDKLEQVLKERRPDIVLVQGDTTTAFAASLAAFYQNIFVGHVEAGLRSHDRFNPFPEEINRKLVVALTDYFFAPTNLARENLLKEGVPEEKIFVTGNTVVDALLYALTIPYEFNHPELKKIDLESGHLILVTAHRRENWDEPLANMCEAFKDLIMEFPDIHIVYPVHMNPNVRRTVMKMLSGIPRVYLIEPVDYLGLVYLMKKSFLILTDSGGIQEEAPTLGKPVLVMRMVTERPEACEAGLAKVIGTDQKKIVEEVRLLLNDRIRYQQMPGVKNPFGDGKAAERIVHVLLHERERMKLPARR